MLEGLKLIGSYYLKEMRTSWVAWVAAFFTALEVIATQSDLVRSIVGEKVYPYVMITVFMIARFRPSKVIPKEPPSEN